MRFVGVNGTQRRVAELRWLLSEGRALRAVRNRTQARQTMTHARHHRRLSSDCASAANVLKSRMVGVHMQVRGVQPAHSSGCCARYMTDRDPKCMRLVCLHVNLTRPLLLRKWSHDTMTTLETPCQTGWPSSRRRDERCAGTAAGPAGRGPPGAFDAGTGTQAGGFRAGRKCGGCPGGGARSFTSNLLFLLV